MKKNRLYLSEEDCNVLMRVTAEMLAMPQLACRLKDCRRKRRCDRVITSTRDAACVHFLPPAQRAVFDTLYKTVILIADDIPDAYPARDPEKRALEEAAIEIIRATRIRRPRMARKFDEWLALYRKRNPEDIENDPRRQAAHGVEPKTYGTYRGGYETTGDEVLNLRESETGQFVVPDDAALDDWRNYK
jgi:hypothetical protein